MTTINKWFAYSISLVRLLLGSLFAFSGYMKSLNMDDFIKTIYKIQFISPDNATYLAFIIIGLELLLGSLLILGLFIHTTLKFTLWLLIVFTIFLCSVLIFGLEVNGCGCFGKLSGNHITILDIFRNMILIGIVFFLIKKRAMCRLMAIDR